MRKKAKRKIIISSSFILLVTIVMAILIGIKNSNKLKIEEIATEDEEITIGEESVLYIDLTNDVNREEKINKMNQTTQKNSQIIEENQTQEENEIIEENIEVNETNTQSNEKQEQNIQVSKNVLNKINQEYFDMEIDLNTETAVVDGEELNIKELFNMSENNELLTSTDDLYNYLSDYLIGDVEYKDGKIIVNNPYSTNTLILKTSNLREIEDGGEIQSIVRVASDVYCIYYDNAEDTKEGYEILNNDDLVDNVCKNIKLNLLNDSSSNKFITTDKLNTLGISSDNYAWGTYTTGLAYYVDKLNLNDNPEIKVAVLDSGIRATHEAFANEETSDRLDMTYSYDYANNDSDPADDYGHGTEVAGIIAQSTSNNVKIIPIKVGDNKGDLALDWVLKALSGIKGKADIINMSFGATLSELDQASKNFINTIETVLKEIHDSGTIMVAATGNDGIEEVSWPACSEYTLGISALMVADENEEFVTPDTELEIADFSNYGAEVDFTAPGDGLIMPWYEGDTMYNIDCDKGLEMLSGTSFSTPYIASAISLLKTENYNKSANSIIDLLKENCEDLGSEGWDKYYGNGNLDFDNTMFSKPVVAKIEVSEEWAKSNTIFTQAICANKIEKWVLTQDENEPPISEWRTFQTPANLVRTNATIAENGTYYIFFKDENNNVTKQQIEVTHVDNTEPRITKPLMLVQNGRNSFRSEVGIEDTESGIAEIRWFYKKSTDVSYQEIKDIYTESGRGETSEVKKEHEFSDLITDTIYNIYAEISDVAGNVKRTGAETITLDPGFVSDLNTTNNNITNNNTTNNNITNNNTTNNNTINNNTINNNTIDDNTINNTTNNNTIDGNTINNTTNNNTIDDNTINNTTNNNTIDDNTINNTTNNNTINNNTIGNNTVNNTISDNKTGNNSTNKSSTGFDSSKGTTGSKGVVNNISINAKSDNSAASRILPRTGASKMILLGIFMILLSGIYTFVKYKKIK